MKIPFRTAHPETYFELFDGFIRFRDLWRGRDRKKPPLICNSQQRKHANILGELVISSIMLFVLMAFVVIIAYANYRTVTNTRHLHKPNMIFNKQITYTYTWFNFRQTETEQNYT